MPCIYPKPARNIYLDKGKIKTRNNKFITADDTRKKMYKYRKNRFKTYGSNEKIGLLHIKETKPIIKANKKPLCEQIDLEMKDIRRIMKRENDAFVRVMIYLKNSRKL